MVAMTQWLLGLAVILFGGGMSRTGWIMALTELLFMMEWVTMSSGVEDMDKRHAIDADAAAMMTIAGVLAGPGDLVLAARRTRASGRR
jgi:hypothetical protein